MASVASSTVITVLFKVYWMATYGDIKELTYKILSMPSDSDEYDETTVVWPKINEVVDIICKGFVESLLNENIYTAWDLPFTKKDYFITTVGKQSLGWDLTTASTTVTVSASEYNSSWAVLIWGDIINYTGTTSSTLTGVTNVSVAHTEWQADVEQLYAMPSNASKPFTMYWLDSNGNRTEIPYHDDRYPTYNNRSYSILIDDAGTEWIRIRGYNVTGDKILLKYYLNSTDMSDDADVCTIPDKYAKRVIPSLAAWELLWEREENELATPKLIKGYKALNEMYTYYANQTKPNRRRVRVADFNENLEHGFERRHRIY